MAKNTLVEIHGQLRPVTKLVLSALVEPKYQVYPSSIKGYRFDTMSIEHRRSCTGSAPHVAKRLYATIVLFIGIICIFGGYLLGRMARNEVKRTNDIVSINLTITADNLYKRSKRVSPKAVHHNDSEKVAARILEAFHCSQSECGTMTNYNVAELVKNCITIEVSKLIRSINNVSLYLDSLR